MKAPGVERRAVPPRISREIAKACPTCGCARPVLNGEFFRDLRMRARLSLKQVQAVAQLGGLVVSFVSLSRMERNVQPFLPKYAPVYDALVERRGRK